MESQPHPGASKKWRRKMKTGARSKTQQAAVIGCVLVLCSFVIFGQAPAASTQVLLSPDQLDNLVAPVALYPDPLLGEVLAASTYPLEIVEAQQWLQQNRNLEGAPLVDAAKQQNWDPSVQALVAFPDALNLLGNDIRWTTGLGNAFLAQQADVMSAVQRMRARAQANGKLTSTPQQVVTTETQNGQSAIEIQPANPDVIYVPVYQPEYIWGPPVWGAYPGLWYPPDFGLDFGFGFEPGIFIGGFFPGWIGWGGWGWGCGWFGNGLFVNVGFFNLYGFHAGLRGGERGRGFAGHIPWTHNPRHRMGVPYPNRAVASRFQSSQFTGNTRTGGSNPGRTGAVPATRGFTAAGTAAGGWHRLNGPYRMGTNGFAASRRQASPISGAGSAFRGYRAPVQSYRGFNSASGFRSVPSYNRSFAPRSYSAPRNFSAPRQSFSAPHFSSGFSGARSGFSSGHAGFSGGHAGFSGGHAGFSGGHAGGTGGRRR